MDNGSVTRRGAGRCDRAARAFPRHVTHGLRPEKCRKQPCEEQREEGFGIGGSRDSP